MFGNTLVLPHADGNITLIKVNQDSYASEYLYKGTLSQYRVRIRHTKTAQLYDRHNVEVVQTIYAAGEVPESVRKCYIVIELLPNDSDTKNADALCDWLIASANAALISLNGWES